MRLHSYRDESTSRHFDLIGGDGHSWSIDLVLRHSFGASSGDALDCIKIRRNCHQRNLETLKFIEGVV